MLHDFICATSKFMRRKENTLCCSLTKEVEEEEKERRKKQEEEEASLYRDGWGLYVVGGWGGGRSAV